MRYLLLSFFMLYAVEASAQLAPIQIGFGGGTVMYDDTTGGSAYLSLGYERLGATFIMGGDGRASTYGESEGRGSGALLAFYEFGDRADGFSFKVNAGYGGTTTYEPANVDTPQSVSFGSTEVKAKNTNLGLAAGVTVAWKFLEVNAIHAPDSQYITFGFKLRR